MVFLLVNLIELQDMFSGMMSGTSGTSGHRRATSLGKGHLSQAAAARLARTSSWNDGLDGAGGTGPSTSSTNQQQSILRVSSPTFSISFSTYSSYRDDNDLVDGIVVVDPTESTGPSIVDVSGFIPTGHSSQSKKPSSAH